MYGASVFDITYDEEMEFKVVGSTEANSLEGKISNESPVGQALHRQEKSARRSGPWRRRQATFSTKCLRSAVQSKHTRT